jgi:outer membrane protein assembly factor BamA
MTGAIPVLVAAALGSATLGLGPVPEASALGLSPWALTHAQTPLRDVITEILVHGNHIASDEDVIKLSGVSVGDPFAPTTISDITGKLKAAGQFNDVTVMKRHGSIDDPSRIVIVIVVNEGPVRIEVPDIPTEPARVVKRRGPGNLMYMPILDAEDGYGLTYGARVAYPGILGERSRLSFPLTWGGLKRAGVELDRRFVRGPFSRVEVGAVIQRRENPAYEEDDDRKRVWLRGERAAGPLRAGATVGWQRVSFADLEDDLSTVGADVAFDTRLDPVLPRNAVFASAAWERVGFESGDGIHRTRLDGRGYVGVFRQNVVVVRAVREDANRTQPLYLRSLLGGWSSLRGFKAGSFTGDTMVTGSIELRMPLTTPLSVGKLGVSVFVDSGTAYDKGQRFRDQTLRTGIGGSVWIAAAAFRMSLSVAHGRGADTRVNFGGGLTF